MISFSKISNFTSHWHSGRLLLLAICTMEALHWFVGHRAMLTLAYTSYLRQSIHFCVIFSLFSSEYGFQQWEWDEIIEDKQPRTLHLGGNYTANTASSAIWKLYDTHNFQLKWKKTSNASDQEDILVLLIKCTTINNAFITILRVELIHKTETCVQVPKISALIWCRLYLHRQLTLD